MTEDIIEQMKRVIEDHERRITRLEMKSNKDKILKDPHLQRVIDKLVKEVKSQHDRTGRY